MATHGRLFLVGALGIAALVGCGGGDGDAGGGETAAAVSPEDLLGRQRAAAHFIESEFVSAFQVMAPLADRPDPALEDLVNAACAALEPEVSQYERARAWVEEAAAIDADDQRVRWARYRIAMLEYELDLGIELLRAILADSPEDIPTKLKLGDRLGELPEPPLAEIEGLYREVVDVGFDFAGSWYKAAVYKLSRILIENDRGDEAEVYMNEHSRLASQDVKSPSAGDFERGNFGSIPVPDSSEFYPLANVTPAASSPTWTFGAATTQPLELAGARGLQAFLPEHSLAGRTGPVAEGNSLSHVFRVDPGAEELLVWGDGGLATMAWTDGGWAATMHLSEPVFAAACLDLGDPSYYSRPESTRERPLHAGDGDVDFIAATEAGLVLLERIEGDVIPREVFAYDAAPSVVLAVDFDHEGDLDLLMVGADGARLLRNDSAHEPDGVYTDVTAEAGLPRGVELAWCLVEDLDHDNDVDLLMGGPGGVFHASNERGGTFSDQSARLPQGLAEGVTAVDRNGDGWADLVTPSGSVWLGSPSGAWPAGEPDATPPGARLFAREVVDVAAGSVVLDKEGDGNPDVVALEGDALSTRTGTPDGPSLRLGLVGVKDNHRGLGAIVEVVLGSVYRREYWRGGALSLATHGRETIDVLRVTWPNGVHHNLVDVPATGALTVKQRPGLVGSCPFLYTWDGETFVFISDVLGITPLGLPMAPGMLVPPDHDEYVLVRGDQMAPLDGEYVIQVTEELREVTYLDQVRLQVIDHPADVEVFPNERFTFPPFPEHHVHTLRGALAPEEARGSDGLDWTEELSLDDEYLAKPFAPLGGQFQGLADPWFVELSFDPEAVRDAEKLRLALNGWLFWTDASVNVAAARHPRVEFIPPILQVPDGEGGWKEAGVLGFPAGKLKTMVVDVTDAIDREDPRLRVFTSLQLYWDSIRLAVDPDDAEMVITDVAASSAELWQRGFSKPVPHPNHPELETFDWDELETEPRWNMHPGAYTKLGPCRELIGAVDDRFVIFGAGDTVTVRFPADGVPPLRDGWERDYLIFFDGWAKDRDPNTLEALYVEPLPFHGMSGYPYGEDESYPNTPEHREYRAEWNTREATRWIESLAPGR